MKKINKTLLLASTLFVSQAVTLVDNSYADEGYDLNVESNAVSNIQENNTENSISNNTDELEIKTKSDLKASEVNLNSDNSNLDDNKADKAYDSSLADDYEKLDSNSINKKIIEEYYKEQENNLSKENTEDSSVETNENVEELSKSINDEEENKRENKKENADLIYYDDSNLDDILKSTNENLANSEKATATKESQIEEKTYYAPKGTGVIVEENNTTKYYENNKLVKNAQVIVNNKFYNIDKNGNATNPKSYWSSIGKNVYYSDETGNLAKGVKEIKNKKYYFDAEGILQRNKIIVTNNAHYDIASNGVMTAPKNKWEAIGANVYYNDNNGNLAKGITQIRGKYYYFNSDGALVTNKKILTDKRYYTVNDHGVVTNKKDTWFAMNGKTYRTGSDGTILKGVQTINNNTYVFDDNGVMYQDTSVISAGKFFNVNKKGIVSVPKNSWVTYNGKKYHTNEAGYVKVGLWKIDGKNYYFTANGLTGNQTIKKNGQTYKVDANGVAVVEGPKINLENNFYGERSLDKTMEWMFNARLKKMTYDMGPDRTSDTKADCSSAVYRSLIYGGFLSEKAWIGNTESLFKMGAQGKIMYEVKESELRYGDIFVAGTPGESIGAGGHTGFILNPTKDTIIHMSYGKNGVSITPRKGCMGDAAGLPVKYFRLVNANSKNVYLNKN